MPRQMRESASQTVCLEIQEVPNLDDPYIGVEDSSVSVNQSTFALDIGRESG